MSATKFCRRAFLVLLPLLIALAAQAPCLAASGKSESSEAKLKRLQSEMAQLNDKIDHEVARKHHLSAKLEAAERQIGTLQNTLAALDTREKRLDAQRASLDKKVAANRGEAEAAQRQLSAALRTAFILGREPRVKLVLEGEDPARAARLLAYYGYYSSARAHQIGELSAEIAHYQTLQTDLAATEKKLAQTRTSQQQSLAALKKSHTERLAVVAQLDHDIANKQARADKLKRAAKRLESIVESVNRDLAKLPSRSLRNVDFAKLRGKLPWPVDGKIVDHFGSVRTDAKEMRWQAVRIAAPAGTQVHAIARGRVAYAGWLPYYGLVLMVD
ncbi:MAG: murein hydrolase activator EnvC family protein, partial [Gammaproteobacteria bacterium]